MGTASFLAYMLMSCLVWMGSISSTLHSFLNVSFFQYRRIDMGAHLVKAWRGSTRSMVFIPFFMPRLESQGSGPMKSIS